MKNILKLLLSGGIAGAFGYWMSFTIPSRFVIEKYYEIQNLEPNNEKDSEQIKRHIHDLVKKYIPTEQQPTAEEFQCFKVISDAKMFCSADLLQKKKADRLSALLSKTIPSEIGWTTMEYGLELKKQLETDIQGIDQEIENLEDNLSQMQNASKKNSAEEKKFAKLNELYRKNKELLARKNEILQKMLSGIQNPEIQAGYTGELEEAELALQTWETQYQTFLEKNQKLAQQSQKREEIAALIDEKNRYREDRQSKLDAINRMIANPNDTGMIADPKTYQLIPIPSEQKFEVAHQSANGVWFGLIAFMVLSNVVFSTRKKELVSFDDATQIEAFVQDSPSDQQT